MNLEPRAAHRSARGSRLGAPTLAGMVIVTFVIASDGTVSSAVTKRSDLGRPDVEDGIVRVVFQARFPPPTGGGIVIARHPFLTSPG